MSAVSGQLTGRTRHRVGWFGKLILQVEYWEERWASDGFGSDELFVCWRDARVEDVTIGEEKEK